MNKIDEKNIDLELFRMTEEILHSLRESLNIQQYQQVRRTSDPVLRDI
jgi:hypothetical protein